MTLSSKGDVSHDAERPASTERPPLTQWSSLDEIIAVRWQTEDPDPAVRHRATLELIAIGHYYAYSDAKHAAQTSLSGAHARPADLEEAA